MGPITFMAKSGQAHCAILEPPPQYTEWKPVSLPNYLRTVFYVVMEHILNKQVIVIWK